MKLLRICDLEQDAYFFLYRVVYRPFQCAAHNFLDKSSMFFLEIVISFRKVVIQIICHTDFKAIELNM